MNNLTQIEYCQYLRNAIKLNYETAIKFNPKNPFFYVRLGIFYEQEKKWETAINYYEESLKIDPNYQSALTQLVNVYEKQENYQQATFYLNKLIDINQHHIYHYSRLANFYRILGNMKGIIDTYELAINHNPYQIESYFWLADFYWELDEAEQALSTYERALVNNSDSIKSQAKIHQELARIAWSKFADLEKEDREDNIAISLYQKLLQSDTLDQEILIGLTNIHLRRKEYEQAINYCDQFIKDQPNQGFGYIKLAGIMMAKGDVKQALTNYERAFSLQLNQPFAHYRNYVICLIANGDFSQALNSLQKLLALTIPTYLIPFIYKKIGEVYQKQNQFNLAEKAFEKAKSAYTSLVFNPLSGNDAKILNEEIEQINHLTLFPYRWSIRQTTHNIALNEELAQQAFNRQMWDEATAIYYYILQINPNYNSPQLYFNLVDALVNQRRYQELTKVYQQVQRVLPDKSKLLEKIESFINLKFPPIDNHVKDNLADNSLVICIITYEKYKNKQQTIRNTWLQEVIKRNIPYFFVIGKPDTESYVDGDILYVKAGDYYENLPQKTYELAKYIYTYTKYQYLFKVDDDCYININNLLRCNFSSKHYMGVIIIGGGNREWHIGKTHNPYIGKHTGDFTGSYLGGALGYFLSRYAMEKIYDYPHLDYIESELYEDKLLGDILRYYHIHPSTSDQYIAGGEFSNKSTDYQLALSPTREVPFPHQNNQVVVFHTDAAPTRLEEIHSNFYDNNYINRIFLRNLNWWQKDNNLVCLERIDKKEIDIKLNDILCFVIVRNESAILPYFLEFYRRIGVNKFFIVDNNSTDNTLSYLLEQSDVYLWHTIRAFKTGKVYWIELLLKTYGVNHWCLTIDADEFLCYFNYEHKNLHQLCNELEQEGKQALSGILLDMYSDQPIKDTVYMPGENPLEICNFFDRQPYTFTQQGINGQITYFGGCRERVCPQKHRIYYLHKVPLIKYDYSAKLNQGQHLIENLDISEQTCCLLHFKYFHDLYEISLEESERKQYASDALQYKVYINKLQDNPCLSMFSPEHSVKYESSQQLLELGIIQNNLRGLFKSNQTKYKLEDCDCLFIIAQGRSGSTLLMRLINTIKGYHICGENQGALINLYKFYENLIYTNHMRAKKKSNENKSFYSYIELQERFMKRTTRREYSDFEWFNIFILDDVEEKLRELIIEMFNPQMIYKVWGCKEIRYGKDNEDNYDNFESELNFLKKLFPKAKFIFNTRNIDDMLKSAFWRENIENSQEVLSKKYEFFTKYYHKYSDFTYHIQYENLINDTSELRSMYDFLGEEFSYDKYQNILKRV
jgi:tetratricopeptide (TPR) repeat protein